MAELKYYELDYEYRRLIDLITAKESQIYLDGKIEGKTQKEKELELFPYIEELQEKKRKAHLEVNKAKAELDHLKRQYQIELLLSKEKESA